jgi:hypothetical protein
MEQVKFREALLRLCTYSTTPENYGLFSTQFWDVLIPALQAEFNDVLHLLPTHASVLEFNCCKLAASAKPVLCCHTKHNHAEAGKANQTMQKDWKRNYCCQKGQRLCSLTICGCLKG